MEKQVKERRDKKIKGRRGAEQQGEGSGGE